MIVLSTQCFPPDLGGIQTYMHSVASELVKRGREVAVYADALQGVDTRAHDSEQPFTIQRFGGLKPLRRRAKARAIARALAADGDKSVILCDTWKSLEHIPAQTCTQARVICLAHGMEFPADSNEKKRRRVQQAFGKADVILANSQFTAARMAPFMPDGKTAEVFLPGISQPPLLEDSARQAVATRSENQSPVLLTISRIEARKGHDKVLAAVARLREQYPDIHYYIMGNGPDRERLEGLVEELALADCVTFLGGVTDQEKLAWLDRCDVFVMPSRAEGNSVEGFGLVYLEAAYYGKPSLAGQVGGAGDAVLDGRTGLLCDSDSEQAVYEGLHKLLQEPTRSELGKAARQRVTTELMWPQVIERLESYLLG